MSLARFFIKEEKDFYHNQKAVQNTFTDAMCSDNTSAVGAYCEYKSHGYHELRIIIVKT